VLIGCGNVLWQVVGWSVEDGVLAVQEAWSDRAKPGADLDRGVDRVVELVCPVGFGADAWTAVWQGQAIPHATVFRTQCMDDSMIG